MLTQVAILNDQDSIWGVVSDILVFVAKVYYIFRLL